MTRSRRSAKAAGARFERIIADHLAIRFDDRIDRKVRTGSRDTGDLGGIRIGPHRVVAELKDCARTDLSGWAREAATEALNDGAVVGVTIHKRHGVASPGEQWVTMTLDGFINLLKAARGDADV